MRFLAFLILSIFLNFAVAAAEKKKKPAATSSADMPVSVPAGLTATLFSPNTVTPCVACLGVAPDGAVFVGIDQKGSLAQG